MAETHIGPGSLLAGRFTLEDLLEETDGAKFWRATDRTLARNVAVHVIPSSDPRASALLNAARSSATVTDGHLLRVLDAAVEDDVVYVVNEWGNGVSLDRILAEGALSPRRAAWVVKEVAEAISIAHRHGVAHGRLLPENVMVTEAGSVKLIGFVIDAVLHGRQQVLVSGRLVSGDHQADVVNLAGLLYASLTGKWPGTVGSVVPSAPLVHGNPLRPRQVRAGVPRSLDAICDQALNPDAHPGSAPVETAHEVFAALSDYIGDPAASQVGYGGGFDTDPSDTAAASAADLWAWQGSANGAGSATPEPDADAPAQESDRDSDRDTRHATGDQPDPDATQAGAPVFEDENRDLDWSESRDTPPPPPPPLAEPEPKPLFAPEPASWSYQTHEPDTATGPQTGGAGPRNGSLPPAWGPDAGAAAAADSPERWDSGGWSDQPPGRTWLRLAALIGLAIVIVVAVVFAFNLGRGSTPPQPGAGRSPGGSPSPRASAHPLAIAGVRDFDPEGDGTENPELAHYAVDGNPNTSWHTMNYYGHAQLGNLKSGVGLVIDLGRQQHLSSVRLRLVGAPTSVQILGQPGSNTAPSSATELSKLGSAAGAGTSADVKLKRPVDTRYFVVWLTSLPQTSAGYYQGGVAEIVPRS